MEKIVVDNLSLQIEASPILKNLSFSVASGQSLVIIGESGSGKTVLTKLMVGLVPPNSQWSGSLRYQDTDLMGLSEKALRNLRGTKIAYMTQNPMAMFNSFQRIRDHFIETLQSHDKCGRAECLDKALKMLKAVRLGHPDKVLHSYPFELSGGMLQRVMLAIILCLDPETLILDEPTSALDAYNRENIIRLLKELLAQGKTLITVTHDYDLARELGGQMLVIYKGDLVEQGAVDEVLDKPQHPYTQELVLENPYERLVDKDA